MENELLPCPFCGGEAELHPSYDMETDSVDGWFAWCNNKECECAPETREHFTESEAIAAWNTRAERICTCGWHGFIDGWGYDAPNYCPNCGGRVMRDE